MLPTDCTILWYLPENAINIVKPAKAGYIKPVNEFSQIGRVIVAILEILFRLLPAVITKISFVLS